mmetsp:Transcript_9860/g.34710  ORF Transcript_9860/g.34710 Transcript_9860/m.34710 type:complete len:341 (-) Transcript_9860:531-1553(-)
MTPPFEIRFRPWSGADSESTDFVTGLYWRMSVPWDGQVAYQRTDERMYLRWHRKMGLWAIFMATGGGWETQELMFFRDDIWCADVGEDADPSVTIRARCVVEAKDVPLAVVPRRLQKPGLSIKFPAGAKNGSSAHVRELAEFGRSICREEGAIACRRFGSQHVRISVVHCQRHLGPCFHLAKQWYARNSRVRLTGVNRKEFSAMIVGGVSLPRAIMCVRPKCGSTRWRRLAIRAAGLEHWDSTDPGSIHDPWNNGLDYLSDLPLMKQEALWNTPNLLKIDIVRSPITRALSAYLSSRKTSQGQSLWSTFAAFVAWLDETNAPEGQDAHLKTQTSFCDIRQ